MGLASTDWLMAAGWRQGLFLHCIEEGAKHPLPFNMQEPPGCYQSRDAGNLGLKFTLFSFVFQSHSIFGVYITIIIIIIKQLMLLGIVKM